MWVSKKKLNAIIIAANNEIRLLEAQVFKLKKQIKKQNVEFNDLVIKKAKKAKKWA